jgi:protein-L-isoaspartate(D-aspartate) O-methyltransferase
MTSADLTLQRRFFADEIDACAGLKTAALVDAFAVVPRERFLPPGPWMLKSDGDFGAPPRPTRDARPERVYHNVAVGIDPARMLFNGQPAFVSRLIDALDLREGSRVLHVGCGTGYYTAVMAAVVGAAGRVVAIEVDEGLAAAARANLQPWPWVEVRAGNASGSIGGPFDAVLVNAGVTHPLDEWLDALVEGGRIVLPLTATGPAMSPIGKGVVVLVTRRGTRFDAQLVTFTAIFSAVGLRDEAINASIGQALQKNPMPRLRNLARDGHDADGDCWLHTARFCLRV